MIEGTKRILLAEDNENDVELTLAALGEHRLDAEVAVARDGALALDFLARRGDFRNRAAGNPAVVLLDIKMPRLDGIDVLRAMKDDPALRSIPVVMLTSSREERDIVRSYELGASAYVVKPVAFPEFVEAVKTLGRFWALLNQPPPGSVRLVA